MNHKTIQLGAYDAELAYRWTERKANNWFKKNGWGIGCNYLPSTSINQLEMWQADTFDPFIMDKELSWAATLGFNTVRVFLHHLLWEQDSKSFKKRLELFLAIANKHGIKTMFVLFDAVWDPHPKAGKQPEPKPNIHNSGWVQCPGYSVLNDPTRYDALYEYVHGIVNHFKHDNRILIWDLYNEPDNMNLTSYKDTEYALHKAELSLELLKKTIRWVRGVGPDQPITMAPWQNDWSNDHEISVLDNYMFTHSDIISFHCYEEKAGTEKRILELKRFNRPMLCTEYMARPFGSTFQEILPLLKKYQVGAYSWGFVQGKSQTHCPWDSWEKKYEQEPEMWFHDIFRSNGSAYDKDEIEFLKNFLRPDSPVPVQKVA